MLQPDYVTQILQASSPVQPTGPVSPDVEAARSRAKLALGIGLMQPVAPGQTPAGHFGRSAATAMEAMRGEQARQSAMMQKQAEMDIKRGQLEVSQQEAKSAAELRKAQARKLHAERLEDKDKRFKASADAWAKIHGNALDPSKVPTIEAFHYQRTGELIPNKQAEAAYIRDYTVRKAAEINPKTGKPYTDAQLQAFGKREYLKDLKDIYTTQPTGAVPAAPTPTAPAVPLHQAAQDYQRQLFTTSPQQRLATLQQQLQAPRSEAERQLIRNEMMQIGMQMQAQPQR